jgi:VCBS repeat-containing protein
MTDAAGLTSSANLIITIHGADDTPVAHDDVASATEAGGVSNGTPGVNPTGNVLGNDTDVDSVVNGETKAVTTTGALAGAHGTLTLSADGSYSYAVDNNDTAVQSLNVGQTLTDTIGYTMTDAAGLTSSANLVVTIHGTNDTPVIDAGNTLNFDANLGQPAAIDPTITLHDVDNTTMSSARVAITAGFEAGKDSLGFVNQHGITGSYDSAAGVLTLSGTASVVDYQAALASVTFGSNTQKTGTRVVQWTVSDGSAQFGHSAAATTALNVNGVIVPPHMFADSHVTTAPSQSLVPASLVVDNGRGDRPLAPAGFDGFTSGGGGTGYHVVHTDAVLTTAADASVKINLALASLAAPLGGDVAYVVARQANGDPLPDWLKFDSVTGTFAGLPPDGAVASIEPDQSGDDIVTGALPPNPDLGVAGPNAPAKLQTITVEVLARDSKGNIAVAVFTIDLRSHVAGKQGWNIDRNAHPFGTERHASLPMTSPELAAIEAAVHGATVEPFALRGMPVRYGDAISVGAGDAAPAGRPGLTEQLGSIGWRSMAAQRNALLASLQQGR